MKNYSEMANEVIRRRDQYDAKRKKRKKATRIFFPLFALLVVVGVFLFSGLGDNHSEIAKAANLMLGIQRNPAEGTENLLEDSRILTDFAVRLLQTEMKEGENVLISPLSVIESLGMTINGADSSTREQMEQVLGLSAEELGRFTYSYQESLPRGEKCQLLQANSIWFRADEKVQVRQDFLQINADYYDAEMFQVPFDRHLAGQVNEWISEKTKGAIPRVLDDASEDAALYLINALSFEAEWGQKFPIYNTRNGEFLLESGQKVTVRYLFDTEYQYLKDDRVSGFMKSYASYLGRKYVFVALLPKEGLSVEDYVTGLSGDDLHSLILGAKHQAVLAKIPKFDVTYGSELSGSLKEMGMTKAFDKREADFSRMASVNGTKAKSGKTSEIHLSKVFHKTALTLNEWGTRASAATIAEADLGGEAEDYEEVSLMRPFVYAIVDDETGFPIFLGICQQPNAAE